MEVQGLLHHETVKDVIGLQNLIKGVSLCEEITTQVETEPLGPLATTTEHVLKIKPLEISVPGNIVVMQLGTIHYMDLDLAHVSILKLQKHQRMIMKELY